MDIATVQAERVVFVSTYAKHRIVMRSPRQRYNANGDLLDFDPGKTLEFKNNRYETEDPEEIAFLRKILGPGLVALTPEEAGEVIPHRVAVAETVATTSKTEGRREYRCPYCARSFPDPLAKGRHISTEHRQEKAAEKSAAANEPETPTP